MVVSAAIQIRFITPALYLSGRGRERFVAGATIFRAMLATPPDWKLCRALRRRTGIGVQYRTRPLGVGRNNWQSIAPFHAPHGQPFSSTSALSAEVLREPAIRSCISKTTGSIVTRSSRRHGG